MSATLDFIHDLTFDDLPVEIVHEAVRCLADTLGVSVAASQTQLSKIICNHAERQFGGNTASIWWTGQTASPAGAALANGMTIDALDAHDGHKLTKGHVGCGVIPGLLAVMEDQDTRDAKELLTSIVIGYEIGTRAGISLHASACDYHTSGAWISLATAALGARQLGLTKMQTREALGIAEYHGPRSQMMRCIDAPTMVKDGSGWGSMTGVSAAYLAQDGFTGAPAITMEAADLSSYWQDLGNEWYVMQQYIKLYPVCRWAQPAVEAVLALVDEHNLIADDVTEIDITTFHEASRLAAIPDTTEQAQYSLPFSVAAALVKGTIGADEVGEKGLNNPEILRLARVIKIDENDEFNAAFPARRFATAKLTLKDGRVVQSDRTEAQGDPENRISDEILWSKFNRLTHPVLGQTMSVDFLNTMRTMPDVEKADGLFNILSRKF